MGAEVHSKVCSRHRLASKSDHSDSSLLALKLYFLPVRAYSEKNEICVLGINNIRNNLNTLELNRLFLKIKRNISEKSGLLK